MVIKLIILVCDPVDSPPANNPLVEFDNPPHLLIPLLPPCNRSPKSVAFAVVDMVTKSIIFVRFTAGVGVINPPANNPLVVDAQDPS